MLWRFGTEAYVVVEMKPCSDLKGEVIGPETHSLQYPMERVQQGTRDVCLNPKCYDISTFSVHCKEPTELLWNSPSQLPHSSRSLLAFIFIR